MVQHNPTCKFPLYNHCEHDQDNYVEYVIFQHLAAYICIHTNMINYANGF